MIRQKLHLHDLFAFVGLDSSALMEMLLSDTAKQFFLKEVYSFEKNLLFTHRVCIGECLGLLVGKYLHSKEDARQKIKNLLEEFQITILEEEPVAEDINYVFGIGKKYGWEGTIANRDALIIASFWKKEIKTVIVRDKIFENVCRELKILSFPFPKFP